MGRTHVGGVVPARPVHQFGGVRPPAKMPSAVNGVSDPMSDGHRYTRTVFLWIPDALAQAVVTVAFVMYFWISALAVS